MAKCIVILLVCLLLSCHVVAVCQTGQPQYSVGAGGGRYGIVCQNFGSWANVSSVTRPPVRGLYAMAYDALHSKLVLFGGTDASQGALGDTWIWDGSSWTSLSPATSPPARAAHAMAFDEASGKLILFGGGQSSQLWFDDTWQWDGSNWTQLFPSQHPPKLTDHALAYDGARNEILLFGGQKNSYGNVSAETWVWNGTNWQDEVSGKQSARKIGSCDGL